MYGTMDLDEQDRIYKINGMEPLEYLTYLANKYDYASKTDHGRLNSHLSGALYAKRLDVYNLPDA